MKRLLLGVVIFLSLTAFPRAQSGPYSAQIVRALAGNLNATFNNVTINSVLLAPSGLVGAPSYSFSVDATKGFWSSGANEISVSIGGVQRHLFLNSELRLLNDAGQFELGGTPDVFISRAGAGIVRVGSSSAAQDGTVRTSAFIATGGTNTTYGNLTPAASGVRFLCISTTGVIASQAAACVGT